MNIKAFKTISLIFPAFNEATRIVNTVDEAVAYFEKQGFDYEIIVAADGDDSTRELVNQMSQTNSRLRTIGNVERRGKGYGIRQAVAIAQGDVIGFADADNKTPITELAKFLSPLAEGAKVVIGSRGMQTSVIEQRQPWYRQVGSKGFAIYMHLVIGLWDIVDTQCGFKFFRAEVARDLFSRQVIDGYMFDVEILYLAQKLGYGIKQVPVRWRDDGDSRLNLLAGNIKNAFDILKIRFRSYGLKS